LKLVIGAPLSEGARNETFTWATPIRVTLGAAGSAGAPTMTAADGTEAALVPPASVADTVHSYVLSVSTPVTVIGAAVAPTWTALLVAPPFLDLHVAVNFVIAEPLFAPAVYDTRNEPEPVTVGSDTARTPVGAADRTVVVVDGTVVVAVGSVVVVVVVEATITTKNPLTFCPVTSSGAVSPTKV